MRVIFVTVQASCHFVILMQNRPLFLSGKADEIGSYYAGEFSFHAMAGAVKKLRLLSAGIPKEMMNFILLKHFESMCLIL
jgi:hypothetical protein